MTVATILESLGRHMDGSSGSRHIDLVDASRDPALAGLATALDHLEIAGTFVVTDANLDQPTSDAVRLVGQAVYVMTGNPATPLDVTATLEARSPGGVDAFVVSLALRRTDWTFSTSFLTLPPTLVYDPAIQGATWTTSFLEGLRLGRVVLSASSDPLAPAQLRGDLDHHGALDAYAGLFSTWPLALSGSVVLPAATTDPPVLDLVAVAPGATITVGVPALGAGASLQQMGLRLATAIGLDGLQSTASALELVGSLSFGTKPPLRLSVPLLSTNETWALRVEADVGDHPIGEGIVELAEILGLLAAGDLLRPAGLDVLDAFSLVSVELSIPPLTSTRSLGAGSATNIAVTLGSSQVWEPPIPFVVVRDVGTRWLVGARPTASGDSTPYLAGAVWGGLTIGTEPNSFTLDVEALIPQFVVTGQLRRNDTIPLGAAIAHFFGDPGPPTSTPLAVTAFSFEADPRERTFQAAATITTDWPLDLTPLVTVKMIGLELEIDVTQSSVGGGITGAIELTKGFSDLDRPPPTLAIGAEFVRSGGATGWAFHGELLGPTPLSVTGLVLNLLGIDPVPAGLPDLAIEAMSFRYDTASKAYHAAGTIAVRWVVDAFGTALWISAVASAEIDRPDDTTPPTGRLSGTFTVNRVALTVARDVGVPEPTYLFRVQVGEVWFSAVTAWVGEGSDRHQVITVSLGGATLGSMIEHLVDLAAPTLGFHLDPPWDVLDQIELSRFALTIDPTTNEVSLTYEVEVDLVVMNVVRIGVRYHRTGGSPAVDLILDGTFFGVDHRGDNALSWNVVDDPPPAVPGQNDTAVDLRYVALGQRITFADTESLDTVRHTLDRLRRDMQPVAETDTNPIPQSAMVFSPDSEWLLGLDIGLMETVDLGIVFNDPVLYGLSIQLGGERAGALSGLSFEILYKRITDDVGMFRIELRLPEAFRHIELGEVSITLGVIVLEIFTNGSFVADLGFPHDRDFDRSFTVEVFPFIGRGGIYFGVLDGATSTHVPAITNGTFAPVLELGIGLAVGVGKDVSLGPLSGGISVEVEVIFQGVLAWFNPSSSAAPAAHYYRVQGIAAIHGKLYGKIDFKVIKASVTIEASAEVSVVFESHQPAIFRLAVAVTVEAEVEFLFITAHFSFEADLDVSFTIGSATATPWILASGGGTGGTSVARQVPDRGRTRRMLAEHHDRTRLTLVALPDGVAAAPPALNWDPTLHVLGDAAEPIPLTMLPAFSAHDIPLAWDGTVPPHPDPSPRVALLLFAATGIDPSARTVADTRARTADASAHAEVPTDLAASTMVEAFLRWAIAAVTIPKPPAGEPPAPAPTTVTAGQMDRLAAQIDDAATVATGFSLDSLVTFFTTNMHLQVSGDPGGTAMAHGAMAVPMPPALTMTWTGAGAGTVDFATQTPIGPLYEHGAAAYMAAFATLDPGDGPAPPDPVAARESFATSMFRDWCLLLAKTAVQAADDAVRSWQEPVEPAITTLAAVAGRFPQATVDHTVRAGDTLAEVAQLYGLTAAELGWLDPDLARLLGATPVGSSLPITLGVTVQALAVDNAATALVPGTFPLGAVRYQVRRGDTLAAIATTFGLAGPAALLTGTRLADDRRILDAGATFPVPASRFPNPGGFTPLLTAAVLFVRLATPTGIPHADWFAQTVVAANPDAFTPLGPDGLLPPGTPLAVPTRPGDVDRPTWTTYTTVAGDTATRVGAALALALDPSATGDLAGWPAYRDGVRPAAGGAMDLPATRTTVQPGETLSALAQRSVLFGGATPDVVGLLAWVGDQPILGPLGVVPLPAVTVDTTEHTCLGAIAQAYGLDVGDVGHRLATQKVIPAGAQLTVSHLPAQDIDTLVEHVLAGPLLSRVAGMSSRFLLGGLRLPAPEDDGHGGIAATGPLTSILDLSGQQIPAPVLPDPPPPDPTRPLLTVDLAVDATGTPWIELMGSTTVADPETLRADVPGVEEHNRALAAGGTVPAGAVVHTGPIPTLTFSYTAARLAALYPVPALGVAPTAGPAPLALSTLVPTTYGLDHRVELQTPIPLAIPRAGPAPLAGNPSLWPFPAALVGKARQATATPWEVVATGDRRTGSTPGDDAVVVDSTFGTIVELEVQRLTAHGGTYELAGSPAGAAQVLLALWQHLAGAGGDAAAVYVLVAPAPDAARTGGVTVLPVDATATTLVKTNLSTETVPGRPDDGPLRAMVAGVVEPTWFAALADPVPFLTLLWEGTVVGGHGYYLTVRTPGGDALPEGLFDERGRARLRLLVIPPAQTAAAPTGRVLLPSDNCALVAAGLDPSVQALFVETADDSEMTAVATVPPGNVGITLTQLRPQDADAQAGVRRLFSLLTYAVGATGGSFHDARPGPPISPEAQPAVAAVDARSARRLTRRTLAQGIEPPPDPPRTAWRYTQVVPVATMGPASAAPAVVGLPEPALDPYRGLHDQAGLPSAEIQLGFVDVLGNVTDPRSPGGVVTVPVGYTDPVLPVTSWPGATTTYAFRAVTGGAALDISLGLQAGTLAASLLRPPGQSTDAAARAAETYRTAGYQLAQTDVTVSAWTTLLMADGAPAPIVLPTARADLWRFVSGAYAYAATAARLEPVVAFAAGAGTLADLRTRCGVDPATVGTVNQGLDAALGLGPTPRAVPAHVPFAARATATSIAADPQPGWPTPTATAILADPANAEVLPLRPGVALVIPATPVPVGTDLPTPSLADLSAAHHTTPALLVQDLDVAAEVLAEGFAFVVDGQTVTVGGAIRTFAQVAAAFVAIGVQVTVADLATDAATATGMLVAGASLRSLHYVVPEPAPGDPPETLAANASGATVEVLAEANVATPDIWDPGAAVFVGDFPAVPPTGTIREMADRYATTPGLLFTDLAADGATIPATSALLQPGTVAMPADISTLRIPYTVRTGDTLADVADRFADVDPGPAVARLATDNAAMPDLLVAGVEIAVTLGGTTARTTTVAGDSLAAVLARLVAQAPAVTMADLATAVGPTTGLLLAGGLLLCPPALLPPTVSTPADVPARFGIAAADFAVANEGLAGLVASAVPLSVPGAKATVSVTTGPDDTLGTVVARFATAGAETSVAELVAANPSAPLFRAGALAVLPPAPVVLTADLGDVGGGPFPEPVFPLDVGLRIRRTPTLVDPAFRTTGEDGPVEEGSCRIPAPVAPRYQAGTGVSVDAFGDTIRTVFPRLRLATGRVAGESAELWIVAFTPDGIASLTVGPGIPDPDPQKTARWPRIFAVRPLDRDLVHRSIELDVVQADGTLAPAGHPTELQGIDVEEWARELLAAVDLFLSAAYAPALQRIAPTALTSVLDSKRLLVSGIAAGLGPVLQLDDTEEPAGQIAAAEELEQHLGASLAAGYDVAAVVQYDARVTSAWTRGLRPPARLLGDTRVRGAGTTDPGYGLTNAKTALDQTASFVTFLMSVDDVATTTVVPIDPAYELTHLEMRIQPVVVTGAPGYEASDWLTFVPALEGAARPAAVSTDLGIATVPIPERAFPSVPALQGQTATAGPFREGDDLTLAARWSHGVTYRHEHTAQDEVVLTTTYGLLDDEAPLVDAVVDVRPDVAKELARYQGAADALWALLGPIADPAVTIPPPATVEAAASFATLVADVATAWSGYWPPPAPRPERTGLAAGVAGATFSFRTRLIYADDQITALEVETLQVDPGPAGRWPTATYTPPAGDAVPLIPGAVTGLTRLYAFPTPTPAAPWAGITLAWDGLTTATAQRATVELSVARNRVLLPDRPTLLTTDDFVFSTGTVSAPGPVSPLVERPEAIDITALGPTIETALTAAFARLFGADATGLTVTIELSYGYALTPGLHGLRTLVPVALYPGQPLGPGTAATVAAALEVWRVGTNPQAAGGAWVIGLTQQSGASDAEVSTRRPLLHLGELTYVLG